MSDKRHCDNCDKVIDDENVFGAIKVGFADVGLDDACSIDCARALLDAMQQTEWEAEEELAGNPQ